jgi:hypothetical protein
VHHVEHARRSPLLEPLVAHAAAAELTGDGIPLAPGLELVNDSGHDLAVVVRRSAALAAARSLGNPSARVLPNLLGDVFELSRHEQ